MLLALTLLLLGVLLSAKFSVFALIPTGLLLSIGLVFWWALTASLTWDRFFFWILCIAALNVGYLLGVAFRLRRARHVDG